MNKTIFRQTLSLLFAVFLAMSVLVFCPMKASAAGETDTDRTITVGDYEVYLPDAEEEGSVTDIYLWNISHNWYLDISTGKAELMCGRITVPEKGYVTIHTIVEHFNVDYAHILLYDASGQIIHENAFDPRELTYEADYIPREYYIYHNYYEFRAYLEPDNTYYLYMLLENNADPAELQDAKAQILYRATFVPDFSISPAYADKNGWVRINENWYFFENGLPVIGWKYLNGKWYFMNDYGIMLTGLREIDGKRYRLRNDGMFTGWYRNGNYWYYYTPSGPMKTGWMYADGKWYHFNESGHMAIGLQTIDGEKYYFNGTGAMVTGWQSAGVNQYFAWYYFKNSGQAVTGWQYIGNKWYLFAGDGKMLTGWQYTGGKWYYLENSGAMVTGWKQLGGKWYYMDSSGAMVTGTQTISGKTYRFNTSGAWIN